jgi:hypothetical protein
MVLHRPVELATAKIGSMVLQLGTELIPDCVA